MFFNSVMKNVWSKWVIEFKDDLVTLDLAFSFDVQNAFCGNRRLMMK